jgi:hypothetical protein
MVEQTCQNFIFFYYSRAKQPSVKVFYDGYNRSWLPISTIAACLIM